MVRNGDGLTKEWRILNPRLVTPLVSSDGEVFYSVNTDNMTGIKEPIILRSSDIIHDRINALFHPLVGLSPIFASGLAAKQGLSIQNNSTNFFSNGSKPGGILTVPGDLSDEKVSALKSQWNNNYSGKNAGATAVLSGGVSYQPISMTASDAQMIEQLEMTATIICATFHVPPYKIGISDPPSNSAELDSQYYSQCLQPIMENIENLIDKSLELPDGLGIEFDLDSLLRMDTKSRYEAWSTAVKGGWMKINEAREKENLLPVAGGDSPYLQQQNYSLEALAKRDSKDDPFKNQSQTNNQVKPTENNNQEDMLETAKAMAYLLDRSLNSEN